MCCFGGGFIKGVPVIMKMLSEEERLGLLIGRSQDTYEELAISGGGV